MKFIKLERFSGERFEKQLGPKLESFTFLGCSLSVASLGEQTVLIVNYISKNMNWV